MRPHFVSALLLDERGRYLVQIRDETPGILHPGAFGLFGGAVEPGETAEDAIRRELAEEIRVIPADLAFWRTVWVPIRPAESGLSSARVDLFVGRIAAADVPGLDQAEGAGRALTGARTLLLEVKVATSARLAIGLHAQDAIAADGEEPPVERWLVRRAVSA